MDIMYWNNSLRASPNHKHSSGVDATQNYHNGLLLLSVRGNVIRGPGLLILGRVLATTYWLLGNVMLCCVMIVSVLQTILSAIK